MAAYIPFGIKLRLTDKISTAVVSAKNIYKINKIHHEKKTLVSRSRAYGDIVHVVPDNTRDKYRGFPLGKVNASDMK